MAIDLSVPFADPLPTKRKRAAKTSPTQRSSKLLRESGYTVAIAEHWNAYARRRIDLFGFIDLLAINAEARDTLAVQTTSGANVSARVAKLRALPAVQIWLDCGNRLMVHGWAKHGGRGKRKLWDCREVEIERNET